MVPHTELRPAASINSTPPELLQRIFNFLLYARDLDEPTAARVNDIGSLRLICRRFCQLASPLLIPEISVSMTEASLKRLKNVSSHQLIRSGVRSVHVKLPYYDRDMAASLTHFAFFHTYSMERHLKHLESAIPCPESHDLPAWIDADVIKLGEEMISAWQPIYTKDPLQDSDEHATYRNILCDAHREYQILFGAQEQMRSSGVFLSAIASAMAKMPYADRLEITDGEDDSHKKDAYLIDREYRTSLRAVMLEPHAWSNPTHLNKGPDFEQPAEFLHKLPVEIHQAGVTLREMKVECSGHWIYAKLPMSPSERTSFTESLQNLKTLTFEAAKGKSGTNWCYTRQEDARDKIFGFLSAFLQTPGLEQLTIAFSGLTLGSHSLGKVLARAHHRRLKRLRLTGATFRAGELGRYLARVESPCDVVLESTELLGGTWAEEADELRGLSRVSTTVVGPFGAEFRNGQFQDMWTLEEESMLNRYLKRASSVNPFRNKNI
ncbi:hypothetical protein FGADI_1648 [Fusarium gaditjirri]|uniref:F-box domain-containing protein n=1 Tax=Fusarium gaditjirri TaxID=282569 RepID=A0A8H4TKK2_9HYPO|nr:hypothetical protein FGADI_1648 [Fusarium gaditjirri]